MQRERQAGRDEADRGRQVGRVVEPDRDKADQGERRHQEAHALARPESGATGPVARGVDLAEHRVRDAAHQPQDEQEPDGQQDLVASRRVEADQADAEQFHGYCRRAGLGRTM